jgi:hypothetical protein
MAFKMKGHALPGINQRKSSAYTKDDVRYRDPADFDRAGDYFKNTGKFLGGKLKKLGGKIRTGISGAFKKEGETFDEAFRDARDAGVRYFYWNDKKYTTRLKEESGDETTIGSKKKYPNRRKTSGEKKKTKSLDYVPQSQRGKK